MNDLIKVIKIHCQEIKKDKQSFIVSSTQINGTWYKIKFRKTCVGMPTERGLYDLTIDLNECSYENGGTFTKNDGVVIKNNDIIWVHHIVGIRKYTEDEMRNLNNETMSKIF